MSTVTTDTDTARGAREKINYRVLLGSLSGSTIEWFDFLVYGTMAAVVFNTMFFPSSNPFVSTLLAYASFSITFFFRPLGGVLFSHIGDRIGRKKTLFITLVLMGGGTVAIGLLPGYDTIGIAAPILLIVCRIAQGLGIGGEWGGALLLAYEYAPEKRRGLYGSVPQMGISLGFVLAAGVVSLLTLMPEDQFMSWGWRVPFLASIVLVGIGLWIRNGLDETPEFKKAKERNQLLRLPIKEVLQKHRLPVLVAIGAKVVETGPFYIFGTYVVSYATNFLDIRNNEALGAVAIASIFATIWMPIFGHISDFVSRAKLYRWSAVAIALYAFPYYWLLQIGEFWSLLLATTIGLGFLWGSVNAILGTLIAESFAPQVRYTGATLGYQLGAAIAGGTAPIIAASLLEVSGGESWPVAVYIILCAVISIVASFSIARVAMSAKKQEKELNALS
jgi:MHS family shikimate/dehydroshikimate transporter-like MFS transporter